MGKGAELIKCERWKGIVQYIGDVPSVQLTVVSEP